MPALTALALFAMLPLEALATGVFQTVSGDVKTVIGQARPAAAAQNQQLAPGTTITTGANSQAMVRFDDGQTVLLNQNTEFRISDYRYDEKNPGNDHALFDLFKGAMRAVTGVIGRRSPTTVAFRAPQATIGVRGTDFMVVLINPAFISVIQGAVSATNAAGAVSFGAGALGSVASSTVLATSIAASALPAAAAGAFSQMGAVAMGAAAGGAAGGAASGAGAGAGAAAGVSAGAIAAGAAVAAGVAAAAGSGSTTTTTHH